MTLRVELGPCTVADAERLMRGPAGSLSPMKGPTTVEESMRAMLQRSSAVSAPHVADGSLSPRWR